MEATLPSQAGHCKFPEICDRTGQCENWCRHLEGCEAADLREKRERLQRLAGFLEALIQESPPSDATLVYYEKIRTEVLMKIAAL
jgi:hypothetical protein